MESRKTGNAPAHFNVGDLVRVKDLPNLFYSRTQMYVRGVRGTIAARTYEDLLPEDEAWNRDDAQPEQFYIVRFRQKDLWEEYPFDNDTLQTEFPDRWGSTASEPRYYVGLDLGQSRDPTAIAVVRRIDPPRPVPEHDKPKPNYAPGSLEWEEEQRRLKVPAVG